MSSKKRKIASFERVSPKVWILIFSYIALPVIGAALLPFFFYFAVKWGSYHKFEEGAWTVYENKWRCFVGEYSWDGESNVIEIPNEFHGKPVTKLGGYKGRCEIGFDIFPGASASFEEYLRTPFVLVINDNMNDICNVYCWSIAISEIRCSEDNKYFYAKDGVLYDRKTGETVLEPWEAVFKPDMTKE